MLEPSLFWVDVDVDEFMDAANVIVCGTLHLLTLFFSFARMEIIFHMI